MIDTIPIVGRILIRKSDRHDCYVDRVGIGLITEVKAERVTYEPRDGGRRVFTLRKKILAVCDTHDELEKILDFDRLVQNDYDELLGSHESQWAIILGGGQ